MKVIILSIVSSLALLFAFLAAEAQDAQNSAVPNPKHLEDLSSKSRSKQDSMPSSADLQSLTTALSGKWPLSVKFEPSPEMPNGYQGTGEETWSAGPGGYTLLEDERVPTSSGKVYLLGIIWWDGQTKSLRGMECNNQLPYTCDLKGALNDITMNWDGQQFTIDEWETHGGKRTQWHEVWSDITAASFTQTGEVRQSDGSSAKFMSMRATKVAESGK